ncbi:hypothetical protein AB0M91_26725 [Micromonospora rifamycinica]
MIDDETEIVTVGKRRSTVRFRQAARGDAPTSGDAGQGIVVSMKI